MGQQRLVGGHDRNAAGERLEDQRPRGFEAAEGLDDDCRAGLRRPPRRRPSPHALAQRARRGSRTRAAVTSTSTCRAGDRAAASRATAAPIWPRPSRPTRTTAGARRGRLQAITRRNSRSACRPSSISLRPRRRPRREQTRPRARRSPHDNTSKGVKNVVRPSGLSRLFISPGYRAGSSTLAWRLLLSLRPGCCGVAGPVPSATLDKCPQRVRTMRM